MIDKLNSYKETLLADSRQSNFNKVADLFFEDLMDLYGSLPDRYINFIIDIISDPRLFNKEGAENFISVFSYNYEDLTRNQLILIKEAIVSNYEKYENADFCTTICDFIARYYPYELSESTLLRLKYIEESSELKEGFAESGLNTLRTYYKPKSTE